MAHVLRSRSRLLAYRIQTVIGTVLRPGEGSGGAVAMIAIHAVISV